MTDKHIIQICIDTNYTDTHNTQGNHTITGTFIFLLFLISQMEFEVSLVQFLERENWDKIKKYYNCSFLILL